MLRRHLWELRTTSLYTCLISIADLREFPASGGGSKGPFWTLLTPLGRKPNGSRLTVGVPKTGIMK